MGDKIDKSFRPHTELHDIFCEFVNENRIAIGELKGGEPIPQKINLSKPIDQIIELFGREYLLAKKTNAN